MMGITMPGNPHLDPFLEFLQEQTEFKYMNQDQWTSFGRFTQEVWATPSLSSQAFVLCYNHLSSSGWASFCRWRLTAAIMMKARLGRSCLTIMWSGS